MVFKLVAGIPGRPETAWNLPFTSFEYSLAALNTNNDFKHHYKNRIVQNWSAFAPTEVTCMYCGVLKLFMTSTDEAITMRLFNV